MPAKNTPEKFWGRVFILGEHDCWEWLGYRNGDGYGMVQHQGKVNRAHRAAWMLENGDIPNGLHVLHECDNPACCNPGHLFLGTQDENNKDKARKRRSHQPIGDRNHFSKLTPRQVQTMRAFHRSGTFTRRELADIYGLCYTYATTVISGKKWAHLPE